MARTPDIRLSVDFFDHPKTQALDRELGTTGIVALIRLWCWVARFKPSGYLNGMDATMIENAAGWKGAPGVLYAALMQLRFLDLMQDGTHVHDWAIHNGWAANSEHRSVVARQNAMRRWRPEASRNAVGIPAGIAAGNADANAPSPSPYPSQVALPSALQTASGPVDPVRDHRPSTRDKFCNVPGCGNVAHFWQGKRGACRDHADTIG